MLIDLKQIVQKYNLDIKGVIQVGAHWAEEHDIYTNLGVENIVYIEPCSDAFSKLLERFNPNEGAIVDEVWYGRRNGVLIINCACADYRGDDIEMKVSDNNQGQSNSLLSPKLHLQQHPEVVFADTELIKVRLLDDLSFDKHSYSLLVMDVQGAEGLVLKGATETLKHIDIIYTEINTDYTYANNMLVGEMDELLNEFERVETYMPSPNWSWGDAIYIRRSLLQEKALGDILDFADKNQTDYSKKWYVKP